MSLKKLHAGRTGDFMQSLCGIKKKYPKGLERMEGGGPFSMCWGALFEYRHGRQSCKKCKSIIKKRKL